MTIKQQPDDPLALARQARKSSDLLAGREAAAAAWQAAMQAGNRAAQVEAGWLLCFFLYRVGALAELLAQGEATLALITDGDTPTYRVELLRWLAFGACDLGAFDVALQRAHEACELARTLGPADQAMALNTLAGALERLGDPWQAERLMNEALPLARASGEPYPLLVTLNNLGAITIGAFYLLRDSDADDEARAAMQRSRAATQEALGLTHLLPDPAFPVFVEGNLGEALVHLGELEEADERLARALERGRALGAQAQVWRIRCSMGEALLARGRHAAAKATLTALLDELRSADPLATLFRVHHALHRACRALGDHSQALEHLEAYLRIERQRSTSQLRAQSRLFVTRVEAEQARLQAERARLEAQIAHTRAAEFEAHALSDQLTGLANRRHLDMQLPLLLGHAEQRAQPLTLALVDVDLFKSVNDRFGHAVGDRVLATLAQMLRENTRGSDLVARIGGEEFLLVLPDAPPADALEVCERLRARVAAHDWSALAPGLTVTLSLGLAHAPDYAAQPLFERADAAMYRAKHLGRNRVETA